MTACLCCIVATLTPAATGGLPSHIDAWLAAEVALWQGWCQASHHTIDIDHKTADEIRQIQDIVYHAPSEKVAIQGRGGGLINSYSPVVI